RAGSAADREARRDDHVDRTGGPLRAASDVFRWPRNGNLLVGLPVRPPCAPGRPVAQLPRAPRGRGRNQGQGLGAMETTHFGYEQVTPDEKTRRVRGVFDSVAGKYDLMNDLMSGGLHRGWKRFTVEVSGVRPGARVLD